jgi:HK97 family phage major capsid protein
MSPITERPAGTLGAALTPEDWARYIIDGLTHRAVLLASGATRITTMLKSIHVPRLVDGSAAWYDESEEIGEGAPTGDDLVLTPKKVATIVRLSNESVNDSEPDAIDAVGQAMVRAVALEADQAMFTGAAGNPKKPTGIVTQVSASVPGPVTYESVVRAAGTVRAAGGTPDALYLAPTDYTALELATDASDRPLIQPDAAQGPAPTVAGLPVWPTPALSSGTALVAQADQVVVALRQDASVEVSRDALFTSDSTVARVIARVDVGLNDPDGLCKITGSP